MLIKLFPRLRRVDQIAQDVSAAIRGILRSPGTAAAIVVTMGLGIGANAAIFSTLDRVFFRAPGGVTDPGALRLLYAHTYSKQAPWYGPDGSVLPSIETGDLRELARHFRGRLRITGDALDPRVKLEPSGESVLLSFVGPAYFELLGVGPGLGRLFSAGDDSMAGTPQPVAVLSDRFWHARFGADPHIVGRSVRIDATTYAVVGVAPPAFTGRGLQPVDLWVPFSNGGGRWINPIVRLDRDMDPRALDQELTTLFRQLHAADPWVDGRSTLTAAPLLEARGPKTGYRVAGMTDRSLDLLPRLAGVALAVVLIAVTNVASLLVMRSIRRRREIAVRVALGVGRGRLMRQLLIESLLLAAPAAGVALLVAAATGGALQAQLAWSSWGGSIVDWRVMAVAMGLAVIGCGAAGLAPAIFAFGTDPSSILRSAISGATRASARLRIGLLVAQSALCMALLACGGVFLQSLRRASSFDRGFEPDRALLVMVPSFYPNADAEMDQVAERVRALPWVEAAGRSEFGMSEDAGNSAMVGTSAADTVGVGPRGPFVAFVEPRWMRAAGLHLVAGRALAAADAAEPVVVLSEALARALSRQRPVLGACVHVRQAGSSPCRTVVGIVRDFQWNLGSPAAMTIYVPLAQRWSRADRSLIPNYLTIRSRGVATAAQVAELRRVIGPMLSGGPSDLTVDRVSTDLDPTLRPWRLAASLFLALGALGLLAATAGIYSLIASDVAHRSREIGVRVALGASATNIRRLVVGSGLRVIAMGVGIGTVLSLAVGRIMGSLLFETGGSDPAVLVGTATALVLTAAVASLVPAERAARADPLVSLTAD